MRYLITGGCGFVGSNLAAEVLRRGEELYIIDNLFRFGSADNLTWLRTLGEFKYYPFDVRNINDVETVIKEVKPDYIFHLAGQVAMTTSIANPRLDYETNALGTFNLLILSYFIHQRIKFMGILNICILRKKVRVTSVKNILTVSRKLFLWISIPPMAVPKDAPTSTCWISIGFMG